MLYVSAYNKEKGLYGVADTDDDTVTWVTKENLLKYHQQTKAKGYPIRGVLGDTIQVLKLKRKESFNQQMKMWVTKAKTSGIYEDFVFSNDYRQLLNYNGPARSVINIPPVKVISANCFRHIRGTACKFIMPGSVESIGESAFEDQTFLPGSKFDFSSLKEVSSFIFRSSKFSEDCKYDLNFPALETIGRFAFHNCGWISSVKFGDSLKTIYNSAFSECMSLSLVEFGNALYHIGEKAFYQCFSLLDIVIPESVHKIDGDAFYISVERSITSDDQYSITIVGDRVFDDCASGRTEFRI